MRCLLASETLQGRSLRTRETEVTESPTSRAMSLSVTLAMHSPLPHPAASRARHSLAARRGSFVNPSLAVA